MNHADIILLFDYLYWTNTRVLDHAAQLSPDAFVAPSSVTTRSLRDTLVHELDVEWSWRLRLQGHSDADTGELDPNDFPTVAVLRARWQQDETEMRHWLAMLDDHALAAPVHSLANELPRPLWHFLLHILTHAAQQQADAATLLSLAGQSPGEYEFLSFLDTRGPSS